MTEPEAGAEEPRGTSRATTAGLVTVAVVGTVLATAVVRSTPGRGLGSAATGDPGLALQSLWTLGRLAVDVGAAMTIGALGYVALLTRPERSRYGLVVSPLAHRMLRGCSRWSVLWLLGTLVSMVAGGLVDTGIPASQLAQPGVLAQLLGSEKATSYWLVGVVVSAALAVLARRAIRWRHSFALLALATLGVVFPLFIGHAGSDTGHDLATSALALHVPAALLWVGLLVQLLGQGRVPAAVVRRYRVVALSCWTLLAGTGLVLGGVLDPGFHLGSPYGVVLALQGVLLVVVAGLGARTIRTPPGRRRLLGEAVCGAVALGASALLANLWPPGLSRSASDLQLLLGYDLPGRPTVGRLLFDWRIEIGFLVVSVVLAGAYVAGWWRLRRAGTAWPAGRLVAWLAGCLTMLGATSSGLGRYEPAMFSAHMASHVLLSTLAPLLLALGAPLTLARAVADAAPDATPADAQAVVPTGRDLLEAVRTSRIVRWWTHPVVALGLMAWAPYLVYFGGIFDHAARFHWAHLLLDVFYLLAGYGFAWCVVGVDPTPRPVPSLARLGMVLAAMPFTAILYGLVMSTTRLIGNGTASANMYAALHLPWVHSLAHDQWVGGLVALLVNEAVLTAVMIVLVLRWWRLDDPVGSLLGLGEPTRTDSALGRPVVREAAQPQAVGHHEE